MKPLDDIGLKKRLTEAYLDHPVRDMEPLWRQNVMRKIRGIGPLKRNISFSLSFQQMVWKMAPVLCILLIVLITGMVSLDLSFATAINDTFINDPVAVIYNGIFWG